MKLREERAHPLFSVAREINYTERAMGRLPHTSESLTVPVGYPHYDEWIGAILRHGEQYDSEMLFLKKE